MAKPKLVRLYPVPGAYFHPHPAAVTDVEPAEVDELVASGAFSADKPADYVEPEPETAEEEPQ